MSAETGGGPLPKPTHQKPGGRMDVLGWLRKLGLEQYEAVFRDNDIDTSVLSSLTNEDLKDIGVASVGHRRRLLDAFAILRDGEPRAVAPGGERRQLTLMFCDLVGSTALASRFDPEDLSEIIRTYHRTVTDAIGRFDGYVAKFMGDGVLTYFGYPQAHGTMRSGRCARGWRSPMPCNG
jgi:class 3 adenylate cyclase